MSKQYCPDRGDVIWINFDPQAGHEQAGHRPALVLSPLAYNKKIGLVIVCPITTQVKGYAFEVLVPNFSKAKGAILSDQVKSMDWHERQATFFCTLPQAVVLETLNKLGVLLD